MDSYGKYISPLSHWESARVRGFQINLYLLTHPYWSCPITRIALPDSHTKPWTECECESDAERLGMFNGFLLTANLDALFDRFLISIDMRGLRRAAPAMPDGRRHPLGLGQPAPLGWLTGRHR